ncbi:MAG: DUF938 domain-containing protein [Pseudomonadota bacterium]
MDSLPFSQACENNKSPILGVLKNVFAQRRRVLEIASGTGQHACFFAHHMPWLQWQPSDLAELLVRLRPRCDLYQGGNLLTPFALDVCDIRWPATSCDAVFTANSLHIMPESAVRHFFYGLAAQLPRDLVLAIYGPFNYDGQYTSESNEQFDQWLAAQNPASAIRDFEEVDKLASQAGFTLHKDVHMPANNRLLIWGRT